MNIAIVGLGFGRRFIKIYQHHPDVDKVGICAVDPHQLREAGDMFGIPESLQFLKLEDVLQCREIDAVQIMTPVELHAEQTIMALEAGKHTACAVPMATSIDDLNKIIQAEKASGKVYMMMETTVYTRDYIFVKSLVDNGDFGRIQFVRGSHIQNMGLNDWPDYWRGFPPMLYGTHAIAPLLCITGQEAESVVGHGSGRIREDRIEKYGSPFAVETVTIRLKNSDICAEATRSLYDTVRQYRESFDVYGSKMSYEWEVTEGAGATLFEGGEKARTFFAPDADHLLLDEIKAFTRRDMVAGKDHPSFAQGGGHGGSYPHMVQEFVDAVINDRKCRLNGPFSANITATGICGHESCMRGGEKILIPRFES